MDDSGEISALDLKDRLDRGEALLVLDVREPHEWEAGHILGATHIPMNDIPERLTDLPQDVPIVCYCHHGGRSARVQEYLLANKFDGVLNLTGGIHSWSLEVDPEIPTY